jgi:hypothetical protein
MENHLTELLDGSIEGPYSEATCREPDARLMQVARHSGEAPRRRGWAAEPSFRAFAPGGDSAQRIDPREPQPGVNSFVGETGFPPQAPSSAIGRPQRADLE